jgi:Rrf2 family protein
VSVPQYGARVEYALHTLLNLSLAPAGTAPSARDLADFQKLPVAFMRKLLTQLEKSGLIAAAEGVQGGWRLSRVAEDITVGEIVDAAQGHDVLFECREIRARCALWPNDAPPRGARSGVCEIHAVILAAERAMRAELASHTLADIAARVGAKSPRFVAVDVPAWFAGRYASRRAGTLQADEGPAQERGAT